MRKKSEMERANDEELSRDRKKTKLVEPLMHKPSQDH